MQRNKQGAMERKTQKEVCKGTKQGLKQRSKLN
jgi:hypothetical protein